MDKNYVLDTSAMFCLAGGEDGCDTVEDILNSAKAGKCAAYLSFASFMELYYINWLQNGEDAARELIALVKSLPVQRVDSNERITLSAGRIKANHRLSVADAFIAATALDRNAVLVHKDPELEAVSAYVETMRLPYKAKKCRYTK